MELKNAGEGKFPNDNTLNSIINGGDIANAKQNNIAWCVPESTANFVFVANNIYPITISNSDRRHFILSCSRNCWKDFTYQTKLRVGR